MQILMNDFMSQVPRPRHSQPTNGVSLTYGTGDFVGDFTFR